MSSKLKTKKVGLVNIFEFWGTLTDVAAEKQAAAIKKELKTSDAKYSLLNTMWVQEIGPKAAAVLLQSSPKSVKTGLLARSGKVRDILQLAGVPSHFHFLNNEYETARYFGSEFAATEIRKTDIEDRRRYMRLNTVQPLHFWFEDRSKQRFDFFGVITNLSEGGLFIEFIESVSEGMIKEHFEIYDLPLIHMELFLNQGKDPLKLSGKITHGNFPEQGVGIEFYESDHKKLYLVEWLDKHFMEKNKKGIIKRG